MNRAVSFFLKPGTQICSIFLVSILIIGLANIKLNQNVFSDPKPKIEQIASAIQVNVGLNLQNFLEFNVVENNFIVETNLWFEFDPKQVSLKELSNFSFSKGEILEKSEPIITSDKNHDKTLVRYDLRLKFSSNLNYKYFPIQDHKLYLTLNNKNLDSKKISFITNAQNISISDSLYTPGWKPLNANAMAGSRTINLGGGNAVTYPRVVYSIDFMQSSLRYFIFIILPLLIAFLIALCAFAISWRRDFSTIIGIASGSLAAIVGYRYVIEKISPRVSYYMLSDHLFVLFLVLLFAIFFIDIFFRDYLESHRSLRGYVVFGFYLAVIVGWFYLFFVW